MSGETPSFVERLKNRHVFRVAAMYGVTAWVILQIGSVTFTPLGLPGWSETALIVVLIVGFPIALVLAWIYDATPDGIVRTQEGAAPSTLNRSRRIDFAIIGMLIVALAMALFWKHDEQTPAPVADGSIAVLPFVAMSDDADLRHLGEGIAEEITNQLVGRPGLEVASRTSAFQSHERNDATAIAHSLGVSYVLEGSVRPNGEVIRLTVQLIRAEDGLHVWSETFDLPSKGAAVEQDETVRTVSLMVDAQVDLDVRLRKQRQDTASAEAFQHYAAAQRLRTQLRTGGTAQPLAWRQILADVDRAISLDPNFAWAHQLRANVYLNRGVEGASWEVVVREAQHSIDSALRQKPDEPICLTSLAILQRDYLFDLTAAQRTLERVRAIDPGYRFLYEQLATLAMVRGQAREAMQYWQQQIEGQPYNANSYASYARMLRMQGNFTAAEREYDAAIRLVPRGQLKVSASLGRIQLLIARGELEKAKAEFEPLWAEYQYSFPEYFAFLLPQLGHEADARALLANLNRNDKLLPSWVFYAYYGLRDYGKALEWLRRSIDDRSQLVQVVRLPNAFPGLQDEPGYADVLAHLDSLQRSP